MKTFLIVVGGLIYIVSPIDVAPDFIPVLGWLDDIWVIKTIIGRIKTVINALKFNKKYLK